MIPFIDLRTQYERIEGEVNARIRAVLEHGQYIMGPEVYALEERLADYVGTKHCISVSSGTDALLMAMMALGVGPGDEVITSPFTFIATGESIALLGATPVFVDIRPDTYNIDPAKLAAAISPKTKALMPVSLYGQCADFDAINDIAGRHGLPVIEDSAQSFGATYDGKRSGALSTVSCTSFFPSKPLGGYGDGGAIFTDDDSLASILREIRIHGQQRRYYHSRIGINGRLDTLQAAVLLAKLEVFPEEVRLRQEKGAAYTALLSGHEAITPPVILEGNTSVYAQYTIQIDSRDDLQAALTARGIPTAVHYPVPLPRQPAFAHLGLGPDAFPVASKIAERVVSLPFHPYLSSEEQQQIATAVIEVANTLECAEAEALQGRESYGRGG